jgi:hypothetical protein
VRKLGFSATELSKKLGVSQPSVGISVKWKQKGRILMINYWYNHPSLVAFQKSNESKSPTLISKGF